MNNVFIKVPQKLISELKKEGVVYAKTDFNNPYSKEAYNILSDISNFDNFFFGLLDNNYKYKKDIMSMSNKNNDVYLELNLNENECYTHDYYTFTDLIYYLDCEPNMEIAKECEKYLKLGLQEKDNHSDSPIQVIFPAIHLSQVIKIHSLDSII